MGFESPIAPIWVGLPNLHFGFYIHSFFKNITSPLGKLLAIDLSTLTHTRPNYARVCVDLDLTQPRPKSIIVDLENGKDFMQHMVCENIPKYCFNCCLLGHDLSMCRVAGNKPHNVVNDKENKQEHNTQQPKQVWKP